MAAWVYFLTSLLCISLAMCWEVNEPQNGSPEHRGPTKDDAKKPLFKVLTMRTILYAETEILENSNYALECRAEGLPTPVITWLKDGIEIDQEVYGSSRRLPPKAVPSGLGWTVGRLYIYCMQKQYVGNYTCVATTPYERVTCDTSVIMAPSQWSAASNRFCSRDDFTMQQVRPRIHMHNVWVLQELGSDVLLLCRAFGFPALNVKWTKNEDDVVKSNARAKILSSGDLVITHVKWVDMGVYKCKASNVLGHDTITTFLYPLTEDPKDKKLGRNDL